VEVVTAPAQQVVTFRLGDDRFAGDVAHVERVLRYVRPTALPNLPPWMDGVIDHAGKVVPVVDLRARFGLERREPRPESRIIIFSVADEWVGTIVDAVLEVASITADRVAAPPKVFRGLKAEYLRGLVRQDDGLVIFLDIPHLLSAGERLELAKAAKTAPHG
jgi:purine-binding chemotaxis protein CheW